MDNATFKNELNIITQNWILKTKSIDKDGLDPTLIVSTDKLKYREFIFLNMGGLLAKEYNYKTLLLDLNPYTENFHSQFVDKSIKNIQHNNFFDEDHIVNVDRMLSLGILFDNNDILNMLVNKKFSDFIQRVNSKYDVILVNAPQAGNQIEIAELLSKIIPNILLVVKENVSNKHQIRKLVSKLKTPAGNLGNVYVK